MRDALRASTLSPPSGDSERAETAGEDGGEYTGGVMATGAAVPPRVLALAWRALGVALGLARLAAADGPAPLPPAAAAGARPAAATGAAAALAAAPAPRPACAAERCCCWGAAAGMGTMGAWGGLLAAGGTTGVVTGAGAWLMTLARVRAAVQTGGAAGRSMTGFGCGGTTLGVAGRSAVVWDADVVGGGVVLVVAGSGMGCGCVACTWAAGTCF